MTSLYKVTLVHGGVYVVGDQRFERGVPQIIDDAIKQRLEEYAVDPIGQWDLDDEGQPRLVEQVYRQKFEIEALTPEQVVTAQAAEDTSPMGEQKRKKS